MGTTASDAVSLLVSSGADVTARSKRGESPLADAARRGDLTAARLLLDKGADVNAVDYRGYTPLILAAQYDRDSPDLVRLLLSRGADVRAVAEGQSALAMKASILTEEKDPLGFRALSSGCFVRSGIS